MDWPAFVLLVRDMRSKQRSYFRSRDQTTLQECRDLERRVDVVVSMCLNPKGPTLFDADDKPLSS